MDVNPVNYPQLRFPGFTDAWEQRKLGEVADVYDGTHQTPKYTDSGVNFVSVENISSLETEKYISQEAYEKEYAKKQAKKGDVLMTRIGDIGTTRVIETNEALAYYVTLALFKSKKIESNFLSWLISSPEVQRSIWKRTLHIAFPKKINLGEINQIDIMVPKEGEQQKIGDFFKQLDKTIILYQRKLAKLKELKQGYLQKLFPQNSQNVPELRFKGFTDAWEQRKLEKIVDVNSGRDYKHLETGSIPVYGTGGYMLSVNAALSENEDAIGIGRKGTIDNPYILKAPFWTVDTLFYAVPKKENEINFVYGLFQKINWERKDESTSVPSLSKSTINSINMNIPSFSEQKLIGTVLEKLDLIIASNQRKLDKIKELKKGYLQKMFC